MEELLACALLYQAGLFPAGPYRETLDFLFRDDPEDPLLLELEWTAKDMEASVSLLQDACARRMEGFSPDRFGRMLMEGLRVIFEEEGMDLREFGRRAYRLTPCPGGTRPRAGNSTGICWPFTSGRRRYPVTTWAKVAPL